jgi:ABC-type spermidine/putrescine transport system permease subunit I
MLYFAITVPFTVLVLVVVYAFWRLLDENLETETYKAG